MKKLEIYFDSYFTDTLRREMKEYGISKYFIIPNIHSRWNNVLKHFNNHRWPGTDSILIVYLSDEEAKQIIEVIKMMKHDLGEYISLGAVLSPVEEVIL